MQNNCNKMKYIAIAQELQQLSLAIVFSGLTLY